jgi:transcriptional regulator with GAF, ATPase, and Fis domain
MSTTPSKERPPPEHPELGALLESVVLSLDGALARVWIIGPGDSCAHCAMRPECPDQTRCLHLTASAGSTDRLDGPFRRFPLGARRVGEVAVTRKPFIAREDLAGMQLAEPTWLAKYDVRSFAAVPLEHAGVVEGVLAVFSRRALGADDERLLAAFARHAAFSIAGRRALLALEADRDRLASENASLQKALRLEQALLRSRDGTSREGARFMADATGDPGESPRAASPTKIPGASLADIQREAIERALEHTSGRVSGPRGAAALLHMKPTTLESRMKKLGVQRSGRAS